MTPRESNVNEIQIARICHEANRALQQAQNEEYLSPPWDELDQETQLSAIDGVLNVQAGSDPMRSHVNWLTFKEQHGWTYGEVRNDELKQHPCMVPYHQLPESQQRKDALFVSIVRALST